MKGLGRVGELHKKKRKRSRRTTFENGLPGTFHSLILHETWFLMQPSVQVTMFTCKLPSFEDMCRLDTNQNSQVLFNIAGIPAANAVSLYRGLFDFQPPLIFIV